MNFDIRSAALESLAIATRETLTPEMTKLYIERTDYFQDAVFADACRRLEMSSRWFPKLAELVEQCRMIMREHGTAIRRQPDNFVPPSPEAVEAFLAEIRQKYLTRKRHA